MKKKEKTSDYKLNLPRVQNNIPHPDLPTLSAGLIHEIRNPLAAIHLHLQLLENYSQEIQQEGLRDKLAKKISTIEAEVINLNNMLQGFFTLFKSEATQSIESFDFNKLIEQVVEILKPQAGKKNIQIIFDRNKTQLSQEKLKNINPSFLRQILFNLVLNAIQAFKDNQSKEYFVRLEVEKSNKYLYIEVIDNASGISPDVQKKIFDAFYTTGKKKGSGLGLTLVMEMLKSMNGQLEVESELDKGSRFKIILPLFQRKLLKA